MANAAPTLHAAITTPASAGPTARARLNSMPLSADADARSSFETSSGKTARQVGLSNASPAERANVRISSNSGDISPPKVRTASMIATPAIHISVKENQFPAIDDVADGSGWQSENKERQGARRLRQRNVESAGVERYHEPPHRRFA